MLGQDVLLEDLRCVAIELKHGGIKLQNILGADLGRARCLRAHDWPEIGRQLRRLVRSNRVRYLLKEGATSRCRRRQSKRVS